MNKQLLFSITSKDFEIQTFTPGGHGGSGKDTSNTAVRLIHTQSGAMSTGKEHRSNARNRIDAFNKLIATDKFKHWLRIETAHRMNKRVQETPEEIRARVDKEVDEGLLNGTIQVSYE